MRSFFKINMMRAWTVMGVGGSVTSQDLWQHRASKLERITEILPVLDIGIIGKFKPMLRGVRGKFSCNFAYFL